MPPAGPCARSDRPPCAPAHGGPAAVPGGGRARSGRRDPLSGPQRGRLHSRTGVLAKPYPSQKRFSCRSLGPRNQESSGSRPSAPATGTRCHRWGLRPQTSHLALRGDEMSKPGGFRLGSWPRRTPSSCALHSRGRGSGGSSFPSEGPDPIAGSAPVTSSKPELLPKARPPDATHWVRGTGRALFLKRQPHADPGLATPGQRGLSRGWGGVGGKGTLPPCPRGTQEGGSGQRSRQSGHHGTLTLKRELGEKSETGPKSERPGGALGRGGPREPC